MSNFYDTDLQMRQIFSWTCNQFYDANLHSDLHTDLLADLQDNLQDLHNLQEIYRQICKQYNIGEFRPIHKLFFS